MASLRLVYVDSYSVIVKCIVGQNSVSTVNQVIIHTGEVENLKLFVLDAPNSLYESTLICNILFSLTIPVHTAGGNDIVQP